MADGPAPSETVFVGDGPSDTRNPVRLATSGRWQRGGSFALSPPVTRLEHAIARRGAWLFVVVAIVTASMGAAFSAFLIAPVPLTGGSAHALAAAPDRGDWLVLAVRSGEVARWQEWTSYGFDPEVEATAISSPDTRHSLRSAELASARWLTATGFEAATGLGVVPDVTGESAGLLWALADIDDATSGTLTGQHRVAATGVIDAFGNVGPVAGVAEKIDAAVAAGATVVLVPKENRFDVPAAGAAVTVLAVSDLSEAVAMICAVTAADDAACFLDL